MKLSKPLSPEGEAALRAAVAKIEEDPSSWDQMQGINSDDRSSCGTTACLAGHLATKTFNATLKQMAEVSQAWRYRDWGSSGDRPKFQTDWFSISDAAMEALGLARTPGAYYEDDLDPDLRNDRHMIESAIFHFLDYQWTNEVGDLEYVRLNGVDRDPPPTADRLATFKERITKITGIEFA